MGLVHSRTPRAELLHLPRGLVLQDVVSPAESAEVAFLGRTAVRGVDRVVEVLGDGRQAAGDEPAPCVASVQEPAEVRIGPVVVDGEDRPR